MVTNINQRINQAINSAKNPINSVPMLKVIDDLVNSIFGQKQQQDMSYIDNMPIQTIQPPVQNLGAMQYQIPETLQRVVGQSTYQDIYGNQPMEQALIQPTSIKDIQTTQPQVTQQQVSQPQASVSQIPVNSQVSPEMQQGNQNYMTLDNLLGSLLGGLTQPFTQPLVGETGDTSTLMDMMRFVANTQAPEAGKIMESNLKTKQSKITEADKYKKEIEKAEKELESKTLTEALKQIQAQEKEKRDFEKQKALIDYKKETGEPLTDAEKSKIAMSYRKEFEGLPHIKDANEVFSAVNRMDGAWSAYKNNPKQFESKNALDQALIIVYNKMLDPGSVVRESEYARTPQGISVVNRLQGFGEKIAKGGAGLTDKDREDIVNMAKILEDATKDIYNNSADIYTNEANLLNIDPNRVVKKINKKQTNNTNSSWTPEKEARYQELINKRDK